ncbi:MAG: ComEC/Rec2 family competence protein [bacterium]
MTSSKTLFYLSLSFVVGIFINSLIKVPHIFIWGFLFLGILIIFAQFVIRGNPLVIGFCVLFFVLGILRMQISEFNVANDRLSKLNDSEESIILTGTIIKEADIKDTSQKIKVKIDDFGSTVLVTTNRYPEYKYLDEVKITGKLQTPMETQDFSYKNYLLKDHIYSVMYFPKIEIIGKARGSPVSAVYSGTLWLKEKMRKSIQNNFLPPQSSILEGVILGDKSAIPQDVKDKFRITGLSHIIAVSGLHIVVLSSIIMSFLLFFGLGRNLSFYAVVAFIFAYVILVGLPASALRAGIMGVIYLLGQKLGRQAVGSRMIILAGAIMLLFNPLLLFYDVGFQLSFLAIFGLILLEPIIKNFIKLLINGFFKLKVKEKHENVLSLFTVTIAAQIFTLPIIIYNFGSVSFVSLFTNILILPIIYYVMFFGFLSSVAGVIFSSLGWLLSVPCYFLLTYVFWVVDVFSKPWAYKIISNVSWVWLVVSYIFLGVATRYFNRRLRTKFLDY